MITQVLQISTTPIKYEMEIERPRLEYDQDFIPKAKVETKPTKIGIRSRNAEVRIDTYQARKSMGMMSTQDKSVVNAEKGMDAIKKFTGSSRDFGNQVSMINEGVTIAEIYAQKLIEKQPFLYMAFLPSTGAEISWIPSKIQLEFQEGNVQYDWESMRNVMNYIPGSIRMMILEYPSVNIEYTGGVHYVPPSANPDFEAEG